MATRKPSKKVPKSPAKKTASRVVLPPRPPACSRQLTFFTDQAVGPGEVLDSGTALDVDCYQWLHVWVLAQHPNLLAMDDVDVELVFELPGRMGATGLANLELPYAYGVVPTPLRVSSGPPIGGYGGFVVRAPIIGPGVRVIVINNGPQTYDFSVWGYATH